MLLSLYFQLIIILGGSSTLLYLAEIKLIYQAIASCRLYLLIIKNNMSEYALNSIYKYK